MFRFYGSKSKLAKYYPAPAHDLIIEPFAGSAQYSLMHFEKKVILMDADPKIVSLWMYLKNASPKDILSLPDVPNATRLKEIDGFNSLCPDAKNLIGFCCNGGSAQPKNVSGRHNFNSWNRDRQKIADNLYKIRHWNIMHGTYSDMPDFVGTWYIDPPYQDKGKWYKYHHINYHQLGAWCMSRKGQVMVCENMGADWLPFTPLKEINFSHFKTDADKQRKTMEAIYYKETN